LSNAKYEYGKNPTKNTLRGYISNDFIDFGLLDSP